jgi:hypothetical protein
VHNTLEFPRPLFAVALRFGPGKCFGYPSIVRPVPPSHVKGLPFSLLLRMAFCTSRGSGLYLGDLVWGDNPAWVFYVLSILSFPLSAFLLATTRAINGDRFWAKKRF